MRQKLPYKIVTFISLFLMKTLKLRSHCPKTVIW